MRQTTVNAACLLLGGRSYQILTDAWSHADESEPAVAAMNRMPKYVVTRSHAPLGWANSHRVDGDLPTAVNDLKQRIDGDLVTLGSGTLIHSLTEHNLVDEYRLLLFPLILGTGKRMFTGDSPLARFTLTNSTTSPSGVAILTYTQLESDQDQLLPES